MCRRYTYRIMRFRWWCAGARGGADTPCWLPRVVLCGRMQWVWRSDRIRHVLTCRLRTAREETCSAGSSLCKQGLNRRVWGACVPRAADPPAEGVCWTAAQACLLSRLARSAELPAVRERGTAARAQARVREINADLRPGAVAWFGLCTSAKVPAAVRCGVAVKRPHAVPDKPTS